MKTFHFVLIGDVFLTELKPSKFFSAKGIPHSMEGEVVEIKAKSLHQALMQLQQIDEVAGYKIASVFENGKPKLIRESYFQGADTPDELIGAY